MTKSGKRRFVSLRLKFLLVLLIAIGLGIGLGLVVSLTGTFAVDYIYLDEQRSIQRSKDMMDSFRDFVQDNQLSLSQGRELSSWAKDARYSYLVISDENGSVLVDSGWWDEKSYYSALEEQGEDSAKEVSEEYSVFEDQEEQEGSAFYESYVFGAANAPVEFEDGTYQVTIYDFSESKYYQITNIASYAVAILSFVLVMMWYHRVTIKKIIRLTQEVEVIALGNLEAKITLQDQDEIGVLAQHVDGMRDTIIHEMRKEQEAWNANSDLITRMSHDIRTPLTVLIGFLDLVEEGEFSQDPEYQSYLGICRKNAFQLKELADKLFQYFLVFGHRNWEMKLEEHDARTVFEQLIGEHVLLMEERGWKFFHQLPEKNCRILLDPVHSKRLFDNLFSNIEKYADPAQPVEIIREIEGQELKVTMRNRIRKTDAVAESTRIGTKTCQRIVEEMGGRICFLEDGESYTAKMIFPTLPANKQFDGE